MDKRGAVKGKSKPEPPTSMWVPTNNPGKFDRIKRTGGKIHN